MPENEKEMSKYCKAYPLSSLRAYGEWKEDSSQARPAPAEADADAATASESPRVLHDEDYVFLQENYVVTDGIFKNKHILFAEVTDGWKEFCTDVLGFSVPEYAQDAPESAPAAP